ncbi:hypothetical protein ABKP88_05135 [Bifidobacterium bifidum]|uniref:hypothetical protein n=1 Tax=Bifidobacterium bifidum TaxID=1681 RepID=UPI0032DF131F
MKKKIVAVLAAIAAVLGFGFAANTAMADDYAPTVAYGGTTATVTFPAGTFQPNESVTVYYDDDVVANVQQVAEVSKTFNAKADGSLTLLYTFKASQAGKTIEVKAVGAQSGTKTATIKVPATGTGDQSASAAPTTAQTGASVVPYAVAVVLLVAAGIALFAVRKNTTRR